jgi:hypothetical protein
MNIQTQTITKINSLPPDLLHEVTDFVDFLYHKHNIKQNSKNEDLSEGDISDYLHNLIDYETNLSDGKIKW